MRLYLTGTEDPCVNLACEEYLLKNTADDAFMLWKNCPTVVIGKNQNLYAEVNLDETEKRGIRVVRRITGGGAVYHDGGNINYSFISSTDRMKPLDFGAFASPVINALASLGIESRLSGRNDLLARISGTEDWAKFSGNAQAVSGSRILHHGTILFDSDLSVLSEVLHPDDEKLRRKAIASVRSRVTNLRPLLEEDMDVASFFKVLQSFFERSFGTAAEFVDLSAQEIISLAERNARDSYVAGRKAEYAHIARKRTDAGLVVMLWNEAGGRFTEIAFEGDFFGKKDIALLAERLRGTKSNAESLTKLLEEEAIEDYISGVTAEEFCGMWTKASNAETAMLCREDGEYI